MYKHLAQGRLAFHSGVMLFFISVAGTAAPISDIKNTVHNLSVDGPGSVTAVSESQICAFCHTPHGATSASAPLWNRALTTATYQMYDSSSMESDKPLLIGDSSKICLSCHDGTLAIGAVNVLNGKANQLIAMNGTQTGGQMPGDNSGFTRNLGVDLSNDHPISITYDSVLALSDGELRDPALSPQVGERSAGVKPTLPLVSTNTSSAKLECVSCHDPHIRSDTPGEDIKFLRLNRFQSNNDPSGDAFNEADDMICLACHDKSGWVNSAHANQDAADEIYTQAAAQQRDFPVNNFPVWRAACLNCHDTHTVQGSRRLLREGTDSTSSPKAAGNPAIEETCYQCHSNDGDTLTSQGINTQVPDIKSDFQLAVHMPINNNEQEAGYEVHDIGTEGPGSGKDFMESSELLGKGNLMNRHAECTDCHNPHRVIKNRKFNDDPANVDAAGTHDHFGLGEHTNIASGVLRGTWGVEPVYPGATEFGTLPWDFDIKKGNPPVNGLTGTEQSYVTREYQICLKCHSNFAFDEPPMLGHSGGTFPGTNGMFQYTNQAMEFYAPAGHEGEGTALGTGAATTINYRCDGDNRAGCNLTTNNHRSWHPVMKPTGRDAATRNIINPSQAFIDPWNKGLGTQTMYCSDCHGSDTNPRTVEPEGGENGRAWGPHGSENEFLLKGPWNGDYCGNATGATEGGDGCNNNYGDNGPIPSADHLCFKCHNINTYTDSGDDDNNVSGGTGFSKDRGDENLHKYHAGKDGFRCMLCHVAVPHGWKNKALLVNLNDIGPEAGYPPGTVIPENQAPLNAPPYYRNAGVWIYSFATSGNWDEQNCEGDGPGGSMEDACDRMP